MPSLYIVLERKLSGFDDYVNGHALYQGVQDMDPLAEQMGVKPLMAFYGQVAEVPKPQTDESDTQDAADKETEAAAPTTDEPRREADTEEAAKTPKVPQVQWFLISESLETINGYLRYLAKSAYAIPNAPLIKKELLEWQRVLYLASQELRLWYLAVDG